MFGDFPINALAFCYGPLALTIIGFIAAAVWSDADARRTYLRVMDDRPEEEQTDMPMDIVQTDKPITVSTPSNGKISFKPSDNAENDNS